MSRKNIFSKVCLSIALLTAISQTMAGDDYLSNDIMAPWEGGPAYYAKWSNGPSADPNFFPIAVWYQTPGSGYFYQKMGINYFIYLGLSANANESNLTYLLKYGMSGATSYSSVYANSVNSGVIKAWMHEKDEPDNAVSGTTIPVPTASIIADYKAMVAQDSTRPVLISLGQGVAADSWYGRGDRTYHPEDYIEYGKGADILTFDIYPMNVFPLSTDPTWKSVFKNAVAENIWYVAKGVDNLRLATDYKKPIWAWLECTNYTSNAACELTSVHTKAEAWMAIIHGARGIGFFCHILEPNVVQAGVLSDAVMKAEITALNAQIAANALILNTQTVSNAATVTTSNAAIPVDIMAKRSDGFTYIYAVSMRPGTPVATFTLRDFTGESTVEVVGENRTITATNGVFQDVFTNYGVHIYKVATPIESSIVQATEDDDSGITICRSVNVGEVTFLSKERVDRIDVYNAMGQLIKSKQCNNFQGSIQLSGNTYNVLFFRAVMNKKSVVIKLI